MPTIILFERSELSILRVYFFCVFIPKSLFKQEGCQRRLARDKVTLEIDNTVKLLHVTYGARNWQSVLELLALPDQMRWRTC